MKNYLSLAVVCCISLAGCSSSSTPNEANGGENEIVLLTGVFVDSPVAGLTYSTDTQSGVTNATGEFNYVDGELVTFSIGSLDFPSIAASQIVTPISMSPTNSVEDNTAINIAILLQSLDDDDDVENGINILSQASQSTIQLDFTSEPDVFSSSADVVNMVANSGSTNSTVVSEAVAVDHLTSSTDRSAEAIFSESRGLTQMTSEELIGALDGNTVVWGDGSIVYYIGSEIRSPDENVTMGTINFSNNLHCRSWNGGSDKCSSVYDNGNGILYFFVNGNPDSSGGYVRVFQGNTNNL